jgi:hypothetical protein
VAGTLGHAAYLGLLAGAGVVVGRARYTRELTA